jgi:hypothetical protein
MNLKGRHGKLFLSGMVYGADIQVLGDGGKGYVDDTGPEGP